MSINVNDKNLGHATAYAYYKAGGGTMTEAEFTEFMADFGTASQTAVEAAQAALASKTAAQTAATTATNKASEATTAATTATTKAGEASTSASTATSAKDTAVSASQTATTKAGEATTAAATATSAATTATSAKDDAVSAKTAAQTAQTGAETAAASVSASAAQIATNASDISQLKSDLNAVSIKNTASGSIANLADNIGIAFTAFTANIAYKADGWTGATLSGCGINIWDEEWEVGTISASTGTNVSATDKIRSANYIPCVGNTSYCFLLPWAYIFYYDADYQLIRYEGNGVTEDGGVYAVVKTTPEQAKYMRFRCSGTYGASYNNNISINYPSTDTAYHAYDGDTVTVNFGETIYGGSLNVLTGVLTSTLAADGTELAEPVAYQLTAPDVSEMYDTQYIYADTGDVTVQYSIDTKTYTDNAIAAADATVEAKIGTLANLTTTVKTDTVSAINEVNSSTIKNSELDYYIGLNKFNKESVIEGKEVYGDGTLKTESNSAASDFIYVYGAKKLYLQNLPTYSLGMSYRSACFYDEDKELIGDSIGISKAQFSFSCDVPSNAYYFRFSVYQRVTSELPLDYSSVMVTFKEIGSWFEPYTEYLKKIKDFYVPTPNNAPTTKGLKAVIFGDSITETASMNDDGTNYVEGTRHNWPEYATDYLELGSFKNYAKSGARYQDNPDGSYRQSVSNQIALAVADSSNDDADIVIFSLGTNDPTTNLGSYSTAMSKATLNDLDRAVLYEAIRYAFWKVHTKYKNAVCFAALPIQRMAYETPTVLLTAITEMAHRYNFIIIDANAQSGIIRENNIVGGEGNDLVDGLHPNTTGQIKMARLYASVITEHYLWR